MKHINELFFDTEFVAPKSARDREYIAKGVSHPKRLTKPESIEKWEKESKAAAIDEAVDKAVFDGAFCHLVAISCALNDDEPVSFYIDNVEHEPQLLQKFFEYVAKQRINVFVGHNIIGCDLRIIKQRAIVHGIKPPGSLQAAFDAKPWSDNVYDTMLKWDSSYGSFTKMDKICHVLGLDGKKGIDGSMVGKLFDEGKAVEVAAYCEDDVEETRGVYRSMTFDPDYIPYMGNYPEIEDGVVFSRSFAAEARIEAEKKEIEEQAKQDQEDLEQHEQERIASL